MHSMSEFVRMKDNGPKFFEAFRDDVREMVDVLGYTVEDATALLYRQIDFHASFEKEKN